MLGTCKAGEERVLDRAKEPLGRQENHIVGDAVQPEGRGAEVAADEDVVGSFPEGNGAFRAPRRVNPKPPKLRKLWSDCVELRSPNPRATR